MYHEQTYAEVTPEHSFDLSTLHRTHELVRVTDDVMAPELHAGDLVLVRAQTSPSIGGRLAVRLHGRTAVRWVQRRAGGVIRLCGVGGGHAREFERPRGWKPRERFIHPDVRVIGPVVTRAVDNHGMNHPLAQVSAAAGRALEVPVRLACCN